MFRGNSLSVFLGDLLRDVVVDGGAGTVEGDAVPQRDLEEPGDHQDQVSRVTQGCWYRGVIFSCKAKFIIPGVRIFLKQILIVNIFLQDLQMRFQILVVHSRGVYNFMGIILVA